MIPKVKFTAVAGLYNELLNQLAEKDIPVFNIKSDFDSINSSITFILTLLFAETYTEPSYFFIST